MKITVIGPGRWGSTLAWVHNNYGNQVTLWGREEDIKDIKKSRKNDFLELSSEINITSDLDEALKNDYIFIAISAQYYRDFCSKLKEYNLENKVLILAMKGIEVKTRKTLSQVTHEILGKVDVAVLLGPGHPQGIAKNVPTVFSLACSNSFILDELSKVCHTDLVAIEKDEDLIGVEIGGALKNVIGIAAGILDGLNKTTLKDILIVKGPREVGNLIQAMGGKKETAYGLSHLGDYGATVFSEFSRNRAAGEKWVKEKKLDEGAEGVPTAKAIHPIKEKYDLKMPICEMVYDILYEGMDPNELVKVLISK